MQAGKLDRRITVQRRVESQSASGAIVETWEHVSNLWAEKVIGSGSESFREQQLQGWTVVTWRTRRFLDAGLEPIVTNRILEGTRVYEVLEVHEIGRREGWEFVARCRAEDQP